MLSSTNSSLPIVFRIGEHQEAYEALIDAQEQTLLEACDKDVKLAYNKLFSSFREMETVAARSQFDIKGVKLWLHLFWNADGSIAHLGYHLRPNSRNVKRADLEAFLLRFVRYYHFPLVSDVPYALYTSVAFPLYAIKRRSD